MGVVLKIMSLMACGLLLCLGLSDAAQAGSAASAVDKIKVGQSNGIKTIRGEVLRIDDGNYFVKGLEGKEVRVHTDRTTQMGENIEPGERIEAKVNDQNHALSILSVPAVTDRRNDKE